MEPGAFDPYYRPDLARLHHLGFGFHADACAPGILHLLEPVRARGGLVVELGCGSGLLTRHLVDAGHRVVATDASPAMLELARAHAGGAEDIRRLVLPDDPIPGADAIVSVGHVLNYLADEAAIQRALVAIAEALGPDGVLAFDICDLEWGRSRRNAPDSGRVADEWAIVTQYSVPSPSRFVRTMAAFVRNPDGTWRRDDERHENVLIDTREVPGLLAGHGVDATLGSSFGGEELPSGLRTVIGRRPVRGRAEELDPGRTRSDPAEDLQMLRVRALTPEDSGWKEQALLRVWGSTSVARKEELVDARPFEGFVALAGHDRVGLVTYAMRDDECEIVTIQADREGVGIGRALMDAVRQRAQELGARRLWLVTTNNNVRAFAFYQRWGMDLVALRVDGVTRSRALKPGIPTVDPAGIPIRHELELELRLAPPDEHGPS
jgi:SAM-dependent methyltransferase